MKFPGGGQGPFSDRELEQRLLREVSRDRRAGTSGDRPGLRGRPGCQRPPVLRDEVHQRQDPEEAIREYHAGRKGRDTKGGPPPSPSETMGNSVPCSRRFRSACVTVAYATAGDSSIATWKPDHILLGDFDVTLVVDWGLDGGLAERVRTAPVDGRHAEDARARAGTLRTEVGIGTLGYASPEQQAGDWAPGRPGERRLQPGGDSVRAADRQSSVPGGSPPPK